MSVEYRFSEPDYDILSNPVEYEDYIIGNLRSDSFAWCDFNGFFNLENVKDFIKKHPRLVIMDESDNVISFEKFERLIKSRSEHIFALPLDDQIEEAANRVSDKSAIPLEKSSFLDR